MDTFSYVCFLLNITDLEELWNSWIFQIAWTTAMHRDAFCQFPFQWIITMGSYESA